MMGGFRKICGTVLIVGGILTGINALISLDIIAWLCGGALTIGARIINGIFGLAAIGYIIAASCAAREQDRREDVRR